MSGERREDLKMERDQEKIDLASFREFHNDLPGPLAFSLSCFLHRSSKVLAVSFYKVHDSKPQKLTKNIKTRFKPEDLAQ